MSASCIGTYFSGMDALYERYLVAIENNNKHRMEILGNKIAEFAVLVNLALIAWEDTDQDLVDSNCELLSTLTNYSA